ncbi:hypothetical protein [uncultured Devosia sp.]|uniref:hypothetical protein n=1 Tax=uncultured Devosia sp. TaxID=211434 RepID=UPI0035C99B6D
MSIISSIGEHQHAIAPDGFGNAFGLGVSVAVPPLAYFAVGATMDAMGVAPLAAAPFGLPAWIGIAAIAVMLAMWGMAHFLMRQQGDAGQAAGRWVAALIAGVIVLQFALALANPFVSSLLSMLVLLSGIVAVMRVSALSGAAALLLAPGLVWFGLGSLIGFTTLAGGWSPPFALVDHNKH